MKETKQRKMSINEYKKSDIQKFRESYVKKGFELVDITHLCELKMGISGWCNDFNEPDDKIYHIQIHYRNEPIANVSDGIEILDEDRYCVFFTEKWPGDNIADFILFRKVKL